MIKIDKFKKEMTESMNSLICKKNNKDTFFQHFENIKKCLKNLVDENSPENEIKTTVNVNTENFDTSFEIEYSNNPIGEKFTIMIEFKID